MLLLLKYNLRFHVIMTLVTGVSFFFLAIFEIIESLCIFPSVQYSVT